MKTAGTSRKCVTSFGGVSAATAQVSAVIALALEANPKLTLREVQHLLIQASEPLLTDGSGFTPNGAGIFYHSAFGFGLLNAEKLVTLAAKSYPMSPRLKRTITETLRNKSAREVRFCYDCDVLKDETCLNILEHVKVEIRLKTWSIPFRLVLISPSGTKSLLVNYTSTKRKNTYSIVWLTSVHFWNETAFGVWRLEYTEQHPRPDVSQFQSLLTIYGARQRTSNQTHHSEDICDKRKRNTVITTSIRKTTTIESSVICVVETVISILIGLFTPILFVCIKDCLNSRNQHLGKRQSSSVNLLNGSEFIENIDKPLCLYLS